MMGIESNIFPIINLGDLSSAYRLYRIRGLRSDQSEYYQNRQTLIRRLSYKFKSPVTIIDWENSPHLVLREDAPEPESPCPLVRTTVYFDKVPGQQFLDYETRNESSDEICLRFIQFMLQAPLSSHPMLWQPGAGQAFFERSEAEELGNIIRYLGFVVRAVITPTGGIGLCVDIRNKFISRDPLPTHLTRGEFKRFRGRHCIYHYGHRWYDIQLQELSDLSVSEILLSRENKKISLLDYILAESQKPLPEELANLAHDAAAVHYVSNQGDSRAAPAALCYLVHDTQEPEVQQYHSRTILKPHQRYDRLKRFVSQYLQDLRFGNTRVKVATEPILVPQKMFLLPDYEFGSSRILSVRGTPEAQQVSLDNVGRARLALLRDTQAGFYVKERFERQYLILPQSVADSFGGQFEKDLRRAVDEFFPEGHYDPIVVTYKDRNSRTFVEQGTAILESAKQHCRKPGYGLVMIHHTTDRQIRQHDQLAAMVVREFREFDVRVAVNHSAVGQECYQMVRARDGQISYQARPEKRGKLAGYLRNVALNKILLTNERWPFVLATPLHADVTIGIDVKQNTAGFTIVSRHGNLIRTICRESKQKEQLLTDQVKKYLLEIITAEAQAQNEVIRFIVLHRDGRVWQSERQGAYQALELLKREGMVASDVTLTILEIPKTSPSPLRFFDVTNTNGRRPWVDNPQVGFYQITNQREGYICATGRAFPHPGTVQPLHVRLVEGPMSLEECLEDVYYLTALAWTRPEDCTRYPITIKLTDRRLGEDASEYDEDKLEFEPREPEEDT